MEEEFRWINSIQDPLEEENKTRDNESLEDKRGPWGYEHSLRGTIPR